MWIKGVDEEDTRILLFLHKMHNASLEKQRIDDLYDMMNDTNTYNGICTMDNVSGGFHLFYHVSELFYEGFAKLIGGAKPRSSLDNPRR